MILDVDIVQFKNERVKKVNEMFFCPSFKHKVEDGRHEELLVIC